MGSGLTSVIGCRIAFLSDLTFAMEFGAYLGDHAGFLLVAGGKY